MKAKAYRSDELPAREVLPGYRGRFLHTSEITVAFWDVVQNSPLPEHHHPEKQILIVKSGNFRLTCNGEDHVLSKGDMFKIPPDVPHSGMALTDCTLEDIFIPARPGLGK